MAREGLSGASGIPRRARKTLRETLRIPRAPRRRVPLRDVGDRREDRPPGRRATHRGVVRAGRLRGRLLPVPQEAAPHPEGLAGPPRPPPGCPARARPPLLSNTEALFTGVFAFVLLRERLPPTGYIAAAAILGGAVLVTLDLEPGAGPVAAALLGNVLLVLAAASWGTANTVSRVVISHHDIPSYVCVYLSVGTLVLTPIVLVTGTPLVIPPGELPLLLFLALPGSALFTFLFFFAMRRGVALHVGAILATPAAFGVTLAVAFGFPITASQAAGGGGRG